MKFCVIRLGKSSVEEILKLNSSSGLEDITIQISCKQVPLELEPDAYCFIWLGSDNNKGTPTVWKQGLKGIGVLLEKNGGSNYMDEVDLTIKVKSPFIRTLNKTDILRAAGTEYIHISNIPVIGLNTSSNQTVQLVKTEDEGQNVSSLLSTIVNSQAIPEQKLIDAFPEFDSLVGESSAILSGESEIEETDESSVDILIPFDPNLIRLRRDPYTLGELIDRIEHNEINFLTGFQRKANLWNPIQQSRLVESILLRLPLPAFYFDETEDNRWQVIDGLQRTSVFRNFIVDKTLKLEKLEFLKEFNNKGYDDLPRDLVRRIKTFPLTLYIIEKGTPDEVKFNIFKRINTGGLVLTAQEIRHALNQGIPANFVARLANLEEFKSATCYVINTDRMEDRDFITRFVSFYLIPFFQYEPDLDSFMNRGMAALKNKDLEFRKKMKADFIRAMNVAVSVFGDDAFRKRNSSADRRKPLNKALFETISVSFSQLSSEECRLLISKRVEFRKRFIHLNNDVKFAYSISSGTGQQESVIHRFSEINRIVYETIHNNNDY